MAAAKAHFEAAEREVAEKAELERKAAMAREASDQAVNARVEVERSYSSPLACHTHSLVNLPHFRRAWPRRRLSRRRSR